MKKHKRYSFHPACLLFPQLGDVELQELADNIKAKGLLHDIVLYEGQNLDGRNRLPRLPDRGRGAPIHGMEGEGNRRRNG